jgi:thiosulfate reductase cytochrome b subunit
MHWINVVALTLLFMSGLQIFNAHPALYWGRQSYDGRPPVLELTAREQDGAMQGVTRVLGREFNTTGFLGASSTDGELKARGFPAWATLPGDQWLAMGRRWHFFFAWVLVINGLAYLAYSFATRHVQRDLSPTPRDWRSIGRSLKDHLLFRHPQGEAARHYNVLQKLTYLGVIFVLLPFLVIMGLAMSPRVNALLPGWVDWVGGRQSARTLHFIAACLLLLFVLVHVFEVAVTGLWNNLRSMITGKYRVDHDKNEEGP